MRHLLPLSPLLLPILLGPGCQTHGARQSKFPPQDFHLEIVASLVSLKGVQVKQKLQIWVDGTVVYREADERLETQSAAQSDLPIYCRMSAYRMAPESIRWLSRQLKDASALELKAQVGSDRGAQGPQLSFRLTYFEHEINVAVKGRVYGLMKNVLGIINSYMPPGHGFSMPEMAKEQGTPQPQCLQKVPPVVTSLADSLSFHRQELMQLHPQNAALVKDTFALACAQEDWAIAKECVQKLRGILESGAGSSASDVEHLKQLLAHSRRRAGSGEFQK